MAIFDVWSELMLRTYLPISHSTKIPYVRDWVITQSWPDSADLQL